MRNRALLLLLCVASIPAALAERASFFVVQTAQEIDPDYTLLPYQEAPDGSSDMLVLGKKASAASLKPPYPRLSDEINFADGFIELSREDTPDFRIVSTYDPSHDVTVPRNPQVLRARYFRSLSLSTPNDVCLRAHQLTFQGGL